MIPPFPAASEQARLHQAGLFTLPSSGGGWVGWIAFLGGLGCGFGGGGGVPDLLAEEG